MSAPSRRDDPQGDRERAGIHSPRHAEALPNHRHRRQWSPSCRARCGARPSPLRRATSTPEFFSRYHLLERRYVNLEDSAHEGIGCRSVTRRSPSPTASQLVADFYRSFVTTDTDSRCATSSSRRPRSEACLKCHEDDWSDEAESHQAHPAPAHLRVASETARLRGLSQVDRAPRDVHGEAQEDAVLAACASPTGATWAPR